ncbi:hypothetical protein FrCorBMG51_09985 [Protofrankia coriariae]|uniref:Protein kinase domain-containing protein n=1 Tax=Protofrankia coriariae TaxID=1562887 RepID=A0ABR5F4P2_9ACTN|nr:hypothetical protein FrCorBMG51_09985 [Protofrankia coriariae]
MVPVQPLRVSDPRTLGRHRLVGRLGSGGMGVVYLAEGPLGRVAVKLVRAELVDDASSRVRFQREIQACFRVRSPYTAQLVDFELDAEQPWLATEFVDGPDLDRRVRAEGGPLPADAQLTLATGLAEGLAAIHAAGLVHRDLKPSNVLWTGQGPRIIDFGIAAVADARPLTTTGQFVGTPAWVAPEQATGDETTAATDIFAWAGIVVFAATGQPPFGTGRPEVVLSRVLSGGPAVDYDQLAGPLRELVHAALARDPRQRPSAQALRDDLAGISPADSDRAADGTQAAPAESATVLSPTVTVPVRPTAVTAGPPLPATVHDQPAIPARPARPTRWARPAVLGAAVVVVAGAAIAGILATRGSGDDAGDSDSGAETAVADASYQADGPWRAVVRNTLPVPTDTCEIILTSADTGENVLHQGGLSGTWSFQVSHPGNFRWQVSDPGCLVEPQAGAGAATLPFTHQANTGDTDAFTAEGRVAVEILDFNGAEECGFTLRDATTGDDLDYGTVQTTSADKSLLLNPAGRSQLYLIDTSGRYCGIRVSSATA